MSYQTVFVPLQFEETVEAQMKTALLVAGPTGGHVQAKHVRQIHDYYPPADFYGTSVQTSELVNAEQKEIEDKYAKDLRNRFDTACDTAGAHFVQLDEAAHKAGLTASWTDVSGYLPEAIAWAARTADISVCATPGTEGSRLERSILESLLMGSGRPVLMVPRDGMIGLPERVFVAWDGSLQAARATSAAMPFLKSADEVIVATVDKEDFHAPDLDDAAGYLARHGVKVVPSELTRGKRSVANRLIDEATDTQSDLIVMGGYSHARLQERLIGGVTRHMIAHADRPLLITH